MKNQNNQRRSIAPQGRFFQEKLSSESWQDISECDATGAVTGIDYVGGLVGYCEGTYASNVQHGSVSKSSATGKVTGTDAYTGGLIGYARGESDYGGTLLIDSCYSTGKIVSSGDLVGGLVAWQDEGLVSCTASYWNTVTSGLNDSVLGEGATTAAMTASTVLADWGWDTSIWGQSASINNGYPYLLWSVK